MAEAQETFLHPIALRGVRARAAHRVDTRNGADPAGVGSDIFSRRRAHRLAENAMRR